MEKRKKFGLALGSGGFRGFAHIGVIRSLEKHGIKIDALSGSSSGAWVAASYALVKDITKLESDLTDKTRENWQMLFDVNWKSGFIVGQKFSKFLQSTFEKKHFVDTKIPLYIIASDLNTGKPYVFQEGDLTTAVRASTSVPLVFKPVELDDKVLADGGLCDPVPGKILKDKKIEIVVGVNLYNKNEFVNQTLSMTNIAIRSMRILLYNLAAESIKNCDLVINLDLSKYSSVNGLAKLFTKKISNEIINLGETETDKMIPQIKALLNK